MHSNDEINLKEIYALFPEMNQKTVSWKLHTLVQQGKLHKTGHGYYSMQMNRESSITVGYDYLQKQSQRIYDILIDYGYDFYITGLDALVGEVLHVPENYPALIIVNQTSMNAIQELLSEHGLIVLTEKDRIILEKSTIRKRTDAILFRGRDFSLSTDHISQKEKGFVDLYYAVTRMEYGVSIPELSRIYESLQRNNSITMEKLKHAAKDRGIAREIIWLIDLDKVSAKSLEFMSHQIKEVESRK